MNKRGFRAKLALVLMVLTMVLSSAFTAFAAGDEISSTSSSDPLYSMIKNLIQSTDADDEDDVELLDSVFSTFSSASDSSSAADGTVQLVHISWTHDGDTADKYYTNVSLDGSSTDDSFIEVYNSIKTEIEEAGRVAAANDATAKAVKNQINSISNIANPVANLQAGNNILKPFIPFINRAMGTVVVAAILILGLVTALDIFYLIIPIVKTKCDSVGQSGGKMSSTTKNTGESKFRLISDDAIAAYSEAQENGRHPVWVYLGKRTKTYIAAVVVIFLLLSGNLSLIFNIVLTLIGGILTEATNMFRDMNV